MARGKAETIRRLMQGNLVKLCGHRYGHELPDDDAGRECIFDLLVVASLARVDPAKKMSNMVELQAPWMNGGESETIDIVNRMPILERWRIAKTLGERHRVTNAERDRLGLKNILPCDKTKEELAELRKAKDRERKKRKRAEEKRMTRAAYLAQFAKSANRTKPWLAFGVSKASFYRQKAREIMDG